MTTPTLGLISPRQATFAPDDTEAELRALYGTPTPAPGRRSTVRASMISTVDGAAAGPDGLSGSINNAADHRVFTLLRSVADVVLVGAGTVRAEGYRGITLPEPLRQVRRAAGLPAVPRLAVLTRTGGLPTEMLTTDPAPIVLTTADGARRLTDGGAPLTGPEVIVLDDPTPDAAIAALAAHGLHQVLLEGGPSLLGQFIDAGLLDELCTTTSNLVVAGDAGRIAHSHTTGLTALTLAHVLRWESTLLTRWVVER